jgi:hypothetical protein
VTQPVSSQQRHFIEITLSHWNQQMSAAFLFWIPAFDPLRPVRPQQPFPVLGPICSEDRLRRKYRPWSDDDIAQLKRLQASVGGAA